MLDTISESRRIVPCVLTEARWLRSPSPPPPPESYKTGRTGNPTVADHRSPARRRYIIRSDNLETLIEADHNFRNGQ